MLGDGEPDPQEPDQRVGSGNSYGLSVIEFQAAAKALAGWDLTGSTADPVDCRREALRVYEPASHSKFRCAGKDRIWCQAAMNDLREYCGRRSR